MRYKQCIFIIHYPKFIILIKIYNTDEYGDEEVQI